MQYVRLYYFLHRQCKLDKNYSLFFNYLCWKNCYKFTKFQIYYCKGGWMKSYFSFIICVGKKVTSLPNFKYIARVGG